MNRRELMGGLAMAWLKLFHKNGEVAKTVTLTLHLDQEFYEECQVAADSRNNLSVEEWAKETLANAVSDRSILPKVQAQNDCYLCGHSMDNGNDHGLHPDDYDSRGKHKGRCTECKTCNPA